MARSRLKRGDIVTAALSGDFGKPRPMVVVQPERLKNLESTLLCPLTSDMNTHGPTRVLVQASKANGLKKDSLIMADKITALSLARCRERIGAIESDAIAELNIALALVTGLAD